MLGYWVAQERLTCAMTPTHPGTATYHRVPPIAPARDRLQPVNLTPIREAA